MINEIDVIAAAIVEPTLLTTTNAVAIHIVSRLKNAGYSIVRDIPDSERKEYPRDEYLTDTQAGFDVAAREVKELRKRASEAYNAQVNAEFEFQQGRERNDPSLPYEQFVDWPLPKDYNDD